MKYHSNKCDKENCFTGFDGNEWHTLLGKELRVIDARGVIIYSYAHHANIDVISLDDYKEEQVE